MKNEYFLRNVVHAGFPGEVAIEILKSHNFGSYVLVDFEEPKVSSLATYHAEVDMIFYLSHTDNPSQTSAKNLFHVSFEKDGARIWAKKVE